MWRARRKHQEPDEPGFTFKLYVSPGCHHIREAFQATLNAVVESNAHCFKIGDDVYGLLRPDKIVAYFSRFEDLQQVADRLRQALDGCPAHGIPFTAELSDDGLLSWGMDPPSEQPLVLGQERESWRLWVTNRLATALLMAKAAESQRVEPWQFALERLRLEGVDTETWTPAQTIWNE
jgi:hypothetical protein